MNKRQMKKHGLLVEKIEVGSRVLVVNNTSSGHHTGTIGVVTGSRFNGRFGVNAIYKYDDGTKVEMVLGHNSTDLKKLKDKKVNSKAVHDYDKYYE